MHKRSLYTTDELDRMIAELAHAWGYPDERNTTRVVERTIREVHQREIGNKTMAKTIEETFAMMFGNPNPGACHICGSTENLEKDSITGLIGDEPWMICQTHKAEREAAERKAAEEKAEHEARIAFVESMPSHKN